MTKFLFYALRILLLGSVCIVAYIALHFVPGSWSHGKPTNASTYARNLCADNSTSPIGNHSACHKNIFFIETSSRTCLTLRQACAIESALFHNPDTSVTLLLLATSNVLRDFCPAVHALRQAPNFRIRVLHLDSFMADSPLSSWYRKGTWRKSRYKISHMSDALRFLVLWKYGGIYLDLDVVVKKSLARLPTCLGEEAPGRPVGGVMAFPPSHWFLTACLHDFAEDYRPQMWAHNGPGVIQRIIKRRACNESCSLEGSVRVVDDVVVLPPKSFYAVHWAYWKWFFDKSEAMHVKRLTEESYLVHMWNALSSTTIVKTGSGSPYDLEARQNCPRSYELMKRHGWF
ncbi:lactosylceramide 4-alpha-galactosyltransferase-like [Ornithodoros turicata]|uniref:lactosylceramide 4-alpha-galactosyltransferase-like n=1 Tax=Ornithodoros turicata TaxID=34597 RepID=UPI003138F28A